MASLTLLNNSLDYPHFLAEVLIILIHLFVFYSFYFSFFLETVVIKPFENLKESEVANSVDLILGMRRWL